MEIVDKVLKQIGFINVTKEKPIKFSETLSVGWNPYEYTERYMRRTNYIIELIVGDAYIRNTVNFKGILYYNKGWQKFDYTLIPEKDFEKVLINTIKAIENNIERKQYEINNS